MEENELLIRAEGISHRYPGTSRPALVDVSFELEEGGKLLLTGPSGSGKSTLLSLLGGLERVRSGRLTVAGVNLTRAWGLKLARFRGRKAGFVFQHHYLPPGLTGREAVAAPLLWLQGEPPRRAVQRAEELLLELGLTEEETRRPVEKLSGGQRQRVAFARAVVPDPPLLLADEPTAQLDDETADKVLAALLGWAGKPGRTLVLAAHQRYPEFESGFRTLRLDEGRVAEREPAAPG